jgi:hypothetical protein
MRCPKCQFDNPEEMSFCGKCATDLRIDKETPPKSDYHPQSYTPKFLAEKILTSRSSIEGESKRVKWNRWLSINSLVKLIYPRSALTGRSFLKWLARTKS